MVCAGLSGQRRLRISSARLMPAIKVQLAMPEAFERKSILNSANWYRCIANSA